MWRDEPSGADVIAMWHPGGYPNNPGPDANNAQGLAVSVWFRLMICMSGLVCVFAALTETASPSLDQRSGCVTVPGLDEALCWAFRTDNSGPPVSMNEVLCMPSVEPRPLTHIATGARLLRDGAGSVPGRSGAGFHL